MESQTELIARIEPALREAQRAVAIAMASSGGKEADALARIANAVQTAFYRLYDMQEDN